MSKEIQVQNPGTQEGEKGSSSTYTRIAGAIHHGSLAQAETAIQENEMNAVLVKEAGPDVDVQARIDMVPGAPVLSSEEKRKIFGDHIASINALAREMKSAKAQKETEEFAREADTMIKKEVSAIRQVLREIHHPALALVHEEDIHSYIKVRDSLSKNKKELNAKLQALVETGVISDVERAAFKRSVKARQAFIDALAKEGIPVDISGKMFDSRGGAKEDKEYAARKSEVAVIEARPDEGSEGELFPRVEETLPSPTGVEEVSQWADIQQGDFDGILEEVVPSSNKMGVNEVVERPRCSHAVEAGFAKVGVGLDALLALDGFSELDEGKQLLMLQNYQSAFLGRVGREADKQVEEEWKQQPRIKQLGRMLYTFGTAKTIASHHKQREVTKKLLAPEQLGYEARQAELQALLDLAKEGPTVKVSEEGIRVDYLFERERGMQQLFPEGLQKIEGAEDILEEYNKAATKYANIPRSWFWDNTDFHAGGKRNGITKLLDEKRDTFGIGIARKILLGKEHISLEDARSDYEKARENLFILLNEEGVAATPLEKARIATETLLASDERIRFQQEFSQYPETEKILQGLHDANGFHLTGKVLAEFWSKKGKYAAFGSVVRMTSVAALASLMAPATLTIAGAGVAMGVAGASGFFRGKREARDLLKKKRASGIYSEEDLREKVVFSVDNRKRILELEAEIEQLRGTRDVGMRIRERKEEIERIRERIEEGHLIERHTKELKEFRDAKFFIDRMNRLEVRLEELGADPTPNKDAIALVERKIAQTAVLMRNLHLEGRVNYGQENHLARANGRELAMLITEKELDDKTLEENIRNELKGKIAASSNDFEKEEFSKKLEQTGEELVSKRREEIASAIMRAKDQLERLRINGSPEVRTLLNRVDFAKKLAFADSVTFIDKDEVEKQFSEIGKTQKDLLSEKEQSVANRSAAKSALVAAGFALVGYSVAQTVREWFHHDVAPRNASAKAVIDEKAIPSRSNGSAVAIKSPAQGGHVPNTVSSGGESAQQAVEAAAKKISLGAHEVSEGDNLTGILKERIPELKDLSAHARENAIANFLLKADPEKLKSLGLSDPHHITAGQQIDLDKLHAEFSRLQIGGKSLVEHARSLTDTARIPKGGTVIAEEEHISESSPKIPERVSLRGDEGVLGNEDESLKTIVQPEVVSIPNAQTIGQVIASEMKGSGPQLSYAENIAMAKAVDDSITNRVNTIFGEHDWFLKKIVKRTHITEWKGDPSRDMPGLRNASALHLMKQKGGLSFGTSTQKGLQQFLLETQDETGIKPEQGERVYDYLKRALLEKERALLHMKQAGETPLGNIPKESPLDGIFIRSEPIKPEDVSSLQSAWDAMNTQERIVEANTLLPRLIKTDLEPSVGALKFGAVIERVRTIPAKELLARPADIAQKYDAGSLGMIKKLNEMIQAKQLPPVGSFREKGTIFAYLEQAYRVKLMQGGPAAIMTK